MYLKKSSILGLNSYHNRGRKAVDGLGSDHKRGQKVFKS